MRDNQRRGLVAAIALGALVMAVPASGDGTETLGPASIPISDGSGFATGGTGLYSQPATLSIDIPAGASIEQAILYWEGHTRPGTTPDNTITIGGQTVTGSAIGGTTHFFGDFSATAFRADITGLGIISSGPNSLGVSGLANERNNGAGIAVIYDDGSPATLELRDGLDLAYHAFASPLDTTVPQTYHFAAASTGRQASLDLFAASVGDRGPRPNAVDVTVAGVTERFTSPFSSIDGREWDTAELTVTIPPGATSLTVQALSVGDGSGIDPASFGWIASGLTVPDVELPPPPSAGCSLTQGYWKTHSEHGPAPYDATWALLPSGADTVLLDSGMTWLATFDSPPRGSAWIILAHQWMATSLNGMAGADTTAITTELAAAEALLDAYDGVPNPMSGVRGGVRTEALQLAEALAFYNEGSVGPGHCGD